MAPSFSVPPAMRSAHETANQADVTFAMLVAACRLCTRVSLCNCAMDVRVEKLRQARRRIIIRERSQCRGAPRRVPWPESRWRKVLASLLSGESLCSCHHVTCRCPLNNEDAFPQPSARATAKPGLKTVTLRRPPSPAPAPGRSINATWPSGPRSGLRPMLSGSAASQVRSGQVYYPAEV